jgi:hypothetical protein
MGNAKFVSILNCTLVLSAMLLVSCKSHREKEQSFPFHVGKLIYAESFEHADTSAWVSESQDKFNLADHVRNGQLVLDVAQGITVWNTTEFKGDVMFEFEVTAIKAGGRNDRASDLNCFWMARDPAHPDKFFERSAWRGGVFWHYYTLNLYYVGFGGHDNTKTRMRKYNSTTEPLPPVIAEYTDASHLITPNRKYTIRIVSTSSRVAYFIDGEKLFDIRDEQPYEQGYFGFRTVNNHMVIKNFKVFTVSGS